MTFIAPLDVTMSVEVPDMGAVTADLAARSFTVDAERRKIYAYRFFGSMGPDGAYVSRARYIPQEQATLADEDFDAIAASPEAAAFVALIETKIAEIAARTAE